MKQQSISAFYEPTYHEFNRVRPMISSVSASSFFSIISIQDACRSNFDAFIKSRTDYLENLNFLGDNWISGGSKQPTKESLDISKSILKNLNFWYQEEGYSKYINPRIIMSPTPSGGVTIEIILSRSLKAAISVLDEEINLEVEKDGFYFDKDTDKNSINDSLTSLYNEYGTSCDSRWGNPL